MTPKLHPSITPLILALVALLSGPARAQSPGGGVFKKFDKNGDGKVTAEELLNQQAFARFDANKDGHASPEEVRTYYRSKRSLK